MSRFRPDAITWALLVTLLGGAILRYSGIMWGLPLQLHADEWVIVENAIDLALRNSFEPAFFSRPDHLEIQLSYIVYQAWSYAFHGMPADVLFESTQAPFYAISRAITATFGTGMIVLAYLIGRIFARTIGLWMAVAIAIFPPFVEHSRYATPDIPLTFTVMVVILGCMIYVGNASWWSLALACAGVAAGITVKYPAAIATTAIAAVVIIDSVRTGRWSRILSRGTAAVGMTIVATFLISPVLFTNMTEVVRQLTGQNSDGHLGASGLSPAGNLVFYAEQMLTSGGFLLLFFAAAGAAWVIARRRWEGVPLAVGLVFWVAISMLSLHWERWGLPMYLSVVLFAGVGVHAVWTFSRQRIKWRGARGVTVGLAALCAAGLLAGSVAQVAYALAPDTRAVANADLIELGVTPENAAYDGYTPFLTDGPRTIASDLMIVGEDMQPRPPRTEVDFALTSSTMEGRYLADETREEGNTYRLLAQTHEPIRIWSPAGAPPSSPFALVRIVKDSAYIGTMIGGGSVGPKLTLYNLNE